MERDIVCGALVEEMLAGEAGLATTYAGRTYYFCGYDCKLRFDADPTLFKEPMLEQQRQDNEGGPAYVG